jgi:hypothetical protein
MAHCAEPVDLVVGKAFELSKFVIVQDDEPWGKELPELAKLLIIFK